MATMCGARPFRDFDPILLSPSQARHLAGWVHRIFNGPLSANPQAVAAGVGLGLASARTGRADLARLASAVGCPYAHISDGVASLVDHSLARRHADELIPLLSEEDLPAPFEPTQRYVAAGVQVLAANASVNRWGDAQLVHVATALVALTASSPVRQR